MEPIKQTPNETSKSVRYVPAEEKAPVDYASAIRQYHLYGRGRSMRAFCDDEGYSYSRFCYYARHGQAGQPVAREKPSSGFIELKVEKNPEQEQSIHTVHLSLASVVVEFSNGMVLSQKGGELNALMDIVRKMLS